jgi:DNA-binding IclR family transcriptional regulator
MMGEHSISKSVGRLFQVLELFRETRRPWTTSDLQERLDYPYSSIRVILKSLTDIGYLSYRPEDRTYFPTRKISLLGSWVQSSLLEQSGLNDLVRMISAEINETVGIASRAFIFCNWLQVSNSQEPFSIRLPLGVGLMLTNSVAGRVVLSQVDEKELKRIVDYTKYWSRSNQTDGRMPDADDVERTAETVRKQGYLAEYNVWKKGIGAIGFPVNPSPTGSPLSISIHGSTDRLRAREGEIREAVDRHLAMYSENPAVFAHFAAQAGRGRHHVQGHA